MPHKLFDHAIPFSSFGILSSVLPVGNQVQEVVETDLSSHRVQDIDAEAIESAISGVVLAVVHHDVRRFLFMQ